MMLPYAHPTKVKHHLYNLGSAYLFLFSLTVEAREIQAFVIYYFLNLLILPFELWKIV